MDAIYSIEQAFAGWDFPLRNGYLLNKTEKISVFQSGYRNYLSVQYANKNRKLGFSFFEYFKNEPIYQFSLLIECLDRTNGAGFNTFSLDEYFRKKEMPEKIGMLSLNHYQELQVSEQIRAVFRLFEEELGNSELLPMLQGQVWLDQYYYSIR